MQHVRCFRARSDDRRVFCSLRHRRVRRRLTTATSNDPKLPLGSYTVPGGKTLELTTGVGSGLFRFPGDPAGQFWSVSDRGPNIACGDAEDILGKEGARFCEGVKRGRIYPVPDYSPSIFRLMLGRMAASPSPRSSRCKDAGRHQGHRPAQSPDRATTENAIDGKGQKLEQSASAVDAEAVVGLADGTFWLAEENAPSLLHVAADGKILRRLVPAGTEGDFAQAGYEVEGDAAGDPRQAAAQPRPRIAGAGRRRRRSMLVMQNPLANPDAEAFARRATRACSSSTRRRGKAVAEFVYSSSRMARLPGRGEARRRAPPGSASCVACRRRALPDRRPHRQDHPHLRDRPCRRHRHPGQRLGRPGDLALAGAGRPRRGRDHAGEQALVLDSAKHPELPGKIEGMAIRRRRPLLINDNDFGIEGAHTVITRSRGWRWHPDPALQLN